MKTKSKPTMKRKITHKISNSHTNTHIGYNHIDACTQYSNVNGSATKTNHILYHTHTKEATQKKGKKSHTPTK